MCAGKKTYLYAENNFKDNLTSDIRYTYKGKINSVYGLGWEKKFRSLNKIEKLINIKVRSTGRLLKAKINFAEKKTLIEIVDSETGISPGQACVFYSKDKFGDKVLGGGWIHKTFNKNLST